MLGNDAVVNVHVLGESLSLLLGTNLEVGFLGHLGTP